MQQSNDSRLQHAFNEKGEALSPLLPENVKNFLIDIDGTVCDDIPNEEPWRMKDAQVFSGALSTLNKWFEQGHIITFFLGNDLFSSVIQVIYAFCLGILFAALVIKTNSLLPGIIAHMIINSFSDVFFSALDLKDLSYLILIVSILTTLLGLVILKHFPGETNDTNQNN